MSEAMTPKKMFLISLSSLLSIAVVFIIAVVMWWSEISSYLTNTGGKDIPTTPTKSATNPALVPCSVPGTFGESCLNDLWKSAGCTTSFRTAMDALNDGKTFASQQKYYNSIGRGDVWDDMRAWATGTSDYYKKACGAAGTPIVS